MKIVFRVDVSLISGFGHLSRCLTLANSLKGRGYAVNFISRDFLDDAYHQVIKSEFGLFLLEKKDNLYHEHGDHFEYKNWLGVSQEQDAIETINICKSIKRVDWLIIDHYGIDKNWHQQLRKYVKNIFVIDDLGNRNFECDLLLNQSHDFNPDIYTNLVPESTIKLIGSQYVLLRKEFAELRKAALKKRKNTSKIKNIIIFFGSMDNNNLSTIALNVLESINWEGDPDIKIILGKDSPSLLEIKNRLQNYSLKCDLLVDVKNMGELLLDADLAISAGGMNSWERCCLGLPTLIKLSAKNQIDNIAALEKSGAVIVWDTEGDLKNKLNSMILDNNSISTIENNAFSICDGKGTERVTQEIINAT